MLQRDQIHQIFPALWIYFINIQRGERREKVLFIGCLGSNSHEQPKSKIPFAFCLNTPEERVSGSWGRGQMEAHCKGFPWVFSNKWWWWVTVIQEHFLLCTEHLRCVSQAHCTCVSVCVCVCARTRRLIILGMKSLGWGEMEGGHKMESAKADSLRIKVFGQKA